MAVSAAVRHTPDGQYYVQPWELEAERDCSAIPGYGDPPGCQVGSGALPSREIPSRAVVISHTALSPAVIAARFRAARPPIIGRVTDRRFVLDLRAIFTADDVVPRWDGLDRGWDL